MCTEPMTDEYFDYLESNGLMPAYEAWLENKEDEQ